MQSEPKEAEATQKERSAAGQDQSGKPGTGTPRGGARIQLLYLPGCPLVERVRTILQESLASIGSGERVEEIEGPCASPTLLIDGVDVTGHTPPPATTCRLDLPTREQILRALA